MMIFNRKERKEHKRTPYSSVILPGIRLHVCVGHGNFPRPPLVMSKSRALLASLLATVCLLAAPLAHAQVGMEPVADQSIPSGKTLVVPIPATDPGGPARTYTVTVGTPTVNGTATTVAGVTAAIRTGDPHLIIGVMYSDSNSVTTTGTMEFQLLRELAPQTSSIIAGLTQGGFYSPTTVSGTTKYITFHRVLQGQIIQGGDPKGDGSGGPGFSFPNEYNPSLIFSGTAGQLAMANAGAGITSGTATMTRAVNGTNGSQFFVTLYAPRQYDYQYTLFGQLLRGYDTLFGIAGTPVQDNGSGEDSSPVTPVDITSAAVTQNSTDAVLLLSSTGVCDAPITVTATTVGSNVVTTSTFTAHSIADTTDDPSFIQPSPPDITAPNGSVKVPVSATDLQLDLIAYGYLRALPALDASITSGTNPIITVPLVSNTDNAIAATAIQWNELENTSITPSIRVFHVGAGAKSLTGKLATLPLGSGHLNLGSSPPLAVITDPNPGDVPASLTATVIWGDGSAVLSSTNNGVTIVKAAAGRFNLIAPHDYTSPGEFPIIVRVNNLRGSYLTLTGTANIGPSALAMAGYDFTKKGGILKNQLLATFTDNGSTATPADYTTLVNWGDGAVTSGTVRSLGHSSFQLLGTHTYAMPEAFTIGATVTRTGTYSATTWTTATITGVTAPQVFPPFPQIHLAQVYTILYSDSTNVLTTGSGGGSPYAGLVQGSDGNFYGTTTYGGTNAYGTVYQLTSSGSFNTLHTFSGGLDGGDPYSGLTENGTSGVYYGTTSLGGANGAGTIYSITATGTFNSVYAFSPDTDGGYPVTGLAANGTIGFYGTTGTGGANGGGTVYTISTAGSYDPIYSFTGGSDGGDPNTIITGTDKDLYGTTETGGTNGVGTVFHLTPSGTITTLYTFLSGTTDGEYPEAGLVQAQDGKFYGTTAFGGSSGYGTVFQIASSGSYNSIYSFTDSQDGATPRAALVAGTNGVLYGTAQAGGNYGAGTIYQVDAGLVTSPYSFTNGSAGGNPYAPLITGTDGNLYGTAETGGTAGYGTIYLYASKLVTPLYSFTSGQASQFVLTGGVNIVNSGNKPLLSGSGTYSIYVDGSGTIDGNQTAYTSGTTSVFAIPALAPGKSASFRFGLSGSFSDTRLKLPLNFNPTGQYILGVVTYSDPVGDYDGSVKVQTAGQVPQ
jgi:uncharacterized repeat protein (TIGR03803 family)